MAIRRIPAPAPTPANLGQIPPLESILGGISLQTAMLLLFSAYLLYRMFFSSAANNRRDELKKASDRYSDEIRKIKEKYR